MFFILPLNKGFIKTYTRKDGTVVKAHTDKRIAKVHMPSNRVRAAWRKTETHSEVLERLQKKHSQLVDDAKEVLKHHESITSAKEKGESKSKHGIHVDNHHHVLKQIKNIHAKLEDSSQRIMLHQNHTSLLGDKIKSVKKQKKPDTRSQTLKGNKNAFKGGPKDGKETTIITSRSKDKHKVRYKVIEAGDNKLVASNHADGRINKDYPKLNVKGALQMRDRTNIQSQAQVTQMSNDIEPMLLTEAKIASDGAPITGGDYSGKEGHSIVESGNGRVMALRIAYQNDKADHYKKHLIEEAESFGIDPKVISSMKSPILIRERVNTLDDQEKAKFAKEANKSSVSQMTAIEQAVEDSNYLGGVKHLNEAKGGRITNSNNSEFIKEFFTHVLDNDSREVGKLLNKDGALNDEGERRITNAVFVSVYGANSDIMNKLIMKDSDQTKKITAGMLAAAPRMVKFKQFLAENDRHDMDIASNFIDALTAMEELKKSGISLEEKLKFVGFEELGGKDNYVDSLKNKEVVELLKMIRDFGSGASGSADNIASLLTNYADEAEEIVRNENPDNVSIFDIGGPKDIKKTNRTEILSRAKDKVSFRSAEKKGTKVGYNAYLKMHPEGEFADRAKNILINMR